MVTKNRAERRRAEKVASNGNITLTNRDIVEAREPLQILMKKELPVRTSFALAKLANMLQGHLQAIESVRHGLVQKHGEPMEGKPGDFQVKEGTEEFAKFLEEYNELLSVEVTVPIEVVTLPESVGGKSLDIEAGVLMPLIDKFVTLEK